MTHYAVERVAHGTLHSICTFYAQPTNVPLAPGCARGGTRAPARLGPDGTSTLADYSRYMARVRPTCSPGVFSVSRYARSNQGHLGLVLALAVERRFEPAQMDTGKPPAWKISTIQTLYLEKI